MNGQPKEDSDIDIAIISPAFKGNPPRRYRLIDYEALLSCFGISDPDDFRAYYEDLVKLDLKLILTLIIWTILPRAKIAMRIMQSMNPKMLTMLFLPLKTGY